MNVNNLKYFVVLIVFFLGLFNIQTFANQADSLNIAPLQPASDSILHTNYGAAYETALSKADRAFKMGFYRRAKRFYTQALQINPTSDYIKFRLNEINEQNVHFRNFVFYFNFDKPNLLIKSITYLIVYFIGSMFIILVIILINRRRMDAT